jgi:hypothetical protein
MQIKCQFCNLHRFYSWSEHNNVWMPIAKKIEESVRHWVSLRVEGVNTNKSAKLKSIILGGIAKLFARRDSTVPKL